MPQLTHPSWKPVLRLGRRARWITARSWTNRWYPQGVDTGALQGRRMLAISWFQQDRSRVHLASRVSFIDRTQPRLFDVALAVEGNDGALEPARIHAGGIAWFGDRLFASATAQGIWEFDLSNLRLVTGAPAQLLSGSRRTRTLVAVRTRVHPVDMRCSFISRVFDDEGRSESRVLIGEFRGDERGRIGEFTLNDDGFEQVSTFSPGIRHMQGAVRWGERVFVSQSRELRAGTLWSGTMQKLTPSHVPMLSGCQDLALDPASGVLWSLGEHPWRRVVRGIRFSRLGITHQRRT